MNEDFGAREVYRSHKEIAVNSLTDSNRYTLEQAREIATTASKLPDCLRGEVLDWRKCFFRRIIEVYKNGERKG